MQYRKFLQCAHPRRMDVARTGIDSIVFFYYTIYGTGVYARVYVSRQIPHSPCTREGFEFECCPVGGAIEF